jgi:hypothetical protein
MFDGSAICRATWPLGSVMLDNEAVTLNALFRTYRLRFVDIDCVRDGWLSIEIQHHASDVPETVRIWAIGLSRRLREAIHRHQLKIEVKG